MGKVIFDKETREWYEKLLEGKTCPEKDDPALRLDCLEHDTKKRKIKSMNKISVFCRKE